MKYILNDFDIDYLIRLFSCNILLLTYRRECLDLIFMYNCFHELVDIDIDLWNSLHEDIRGTEFSEQGRNTAFKKSLKKH